MSPWNFSNAKTSNNDILRRFLFEKSFKNIFVGALNIGNGIWIKWYDVMWHFQNLYLLGIKKNNDSHCRENAK